MPAYWVARAKINDPVEYKKYTDLVEITNKRLETISRMTRDEAKKEILEEAKKQAENKAIQIENEVINEARKKANRAAQKIITEAIQRCAIDNVSDSTVSVVSLPSENMKGRIIGREGRNIRALEAATGVNIIVDDTPEAVVLSSFDPLRREISRLSLEKLISDGRIHPARIEEIVEKTKK